MAFLPALASAAATVGGTYLANKMTASDAKTEQLSTQTGDQKLIAKMIKQAIEKGTGPLADLFKGFDMKQFEEGVSKPALQNFTDNILPQLQEKFISGGQAGSPDAARAIGRAGQDLQGTLANLLYQAQNQGQQNKSNNLLSLLQLHQQPTGENVHTPANAGMGPGVFKTGADITGKLAANGWDKYNTPAPAAQPTQAVVG